MVKPIVKTLALTTMLICLCCVSYKTQAQQQAYIKIELDSREVFKGDSVVLDLESTGLLDPIDLSLIEEQADIIRQTTGTRIAVISGKVAEIAIRRMDIVPKNTGVMVLGPLTAGDISSNSVHLKVLDAERPDWQPLNEDLQLKATLTPETALVNQKVLLKIELLHRYPISNESVTLPGLSGFSKRALLENRRTFKGADRDWFSTVWEYLIFPEQSGQLLIEGVAWSGTTAKSRVERADFKRQSPPLTLQVDSPATGVMDWWLPATSLQLTEEWSQPPTELRAGDELNRIIRVEAGSVLAGQIPTPNVPQSRAVQQTLINTKRQEKLTTNSVVSSAEFTYRVKAQSPIPVFLDTVRIPWWNTQKNAATEAIIPARRINVGLPDRADVLSQLALQETGVNRFKHWLQSANSFRLLAVFTGIVSGVYLLWTLVPGLLLRINRSDKRKKQATRLRSLADNGNIESLYRELQNRASKSIMAEPSSQLMRTLEAQLFTARDASGSPQGKSMQGSTEIRKLLDESLRNKSPSWRTSTQPSINTNQTRDRALVRL